MHGREVAWLHALLNYHLGTADDSLPIVGSGAAAFGPRTEAKVKRFQMLNRIDAGTLAFMDGVVGPHTWAALHPLKAGTFHLRCVPLSLGIPELKPGTGKPKISNIKVPSGFTPDPAGPEWGDPPPKPPKPVLGDIVFEPKLHLDNFQLQSGETSTFPSKGPVTETHTLSLTAVFLEKADGFHLEHQVGLPANLSPNDSGPATSFRLTDFGISYALNFANLPGSGDYFNWSVMAQEQLMKSLTDRNAAAAQTSTLLGANISLIKDNNGKDLLQFTFQGGPFLEADAPDSSNGFKWKLKVGGNAFFGVTGFINF